MTLTQLNAPHLSHVSGNRRKFQPKSNSGSYQSSRPIARKVFISKKSLDTLQSRRAKLAQNKLEGEQKKNVAVSMTQRDNNIHGFWDIDGNKEKRMLHFLFSVFSLISFILAWNDYFVLGILTMGVFTFFISWLIRWFKWMCWKHSTAFSRLAFDEIFDRIDNTCSEQRLKGNNICLGELGRIISVSRKIERPFDRWKFWIESCIFHRLSLSSQCLFLNQIPPTQLSSRRLSKLADIHIGLQMSQASEFVVPTKLCSVCAGKF